MVLMTVDHADALFARTHLNTDSAYLYQAGAALPAGPFLTRWLTHLCAPTFLFLAGAGIALAAGRRRGSLDRDLAIRGLLLMALDPLWMWGAFTDEVPWGVQVLFAIGVAMLAMIPLRRLPVRWLVALPLAWFALGEAATGAALHLAGGSPSLPVAVLLTGGFFPEGFLVIYPIVPWLAIMMLGCAYGRCDPRSAARRLTVLGIAALACFALVRGLNGYGNMALARSDGSLLQWLHVSKYPPSLTFVALELGLMALCLAALLRWANRPGSGRGPLLVFGQTALFFYLVHVHLLAFAAGALGVRGQLDLHATWIVTLCAVVFLYPFCLAFRAAKRRWPRGPLRYV